MTTPLWVFLPYNSIGLTDTQVELYLPAAIHHELQGSNYFINEIIERRLEGLEDNDLTKYREEECIRETMQEYNDVCIRLSASLPSDLREELKRQLTNNPVVSASRRSKTEVLLEILDENITRLCRCVNES